MPGSGSRTPAAQTRYRIAESDLPLLLATYRFLAALVLERAARGQFTEILAWEWPCVVRAHSVAADRRISVKAAARATLTVVENVGNFQRTDDSSWSLLLVSDLGTAPIPGYRGILRLLSPARETAESADSSAETEIVVGTPGLDNNERRPRAWRELLERIVLAQAGDLLRVRVLTWTWVANLIGPGRIDDHNKPPGRSGEVGPHVVFGSHVPTHRLEQLLLLIGRHPCLTVRQLASLLGTGVDRIRTLERQLIHEGLLRTIDVSELPGKRSAVMSETFSTLNLVEITMAGRRRLAGWLGLSSESATRYHGVIGYGRSSLGRRWRLLRTLHHTIGANGVFVALAVAAASARRDGGSDQLAEWRSAAACERRQCKPDGYGCYRRDGRPYGLFLEYDRGTEGRRKYAAKFRAYYRYRDSGQAARDYDGFPTLLFVTTQVSSEERIAAEAMKACTIWGGIPLPVLVTTTSRIASERDGILGRIWRRADVPLVQQSPQLVYWPPLHGTGGLLA
jgi:hypothetical protein